MNINSYERIPNDGNSISWRIFSRENKKYFAERNIKNVLKVSFSFFFLFRFLVSFSLSYPFSFQSNPKCIFLDRKKYLIVKCLSIQTFLSNKKKWILINPTDFMLDVNAFLPSTRIWSVCANYRMCINCKVLILSCFSTLALGLCFRGAGPAHLKKSCWR